jgi:undecaprenyl-diphosphatase
MTRMGSPSVKPPPAPLGRRQAKWLWPLLIVSVVGALGLALRLVDDIALGRALKIDTSLILALRRPGHLDVPIGPPWVLQSAIDISALGGFTLQWLFGASAVTFLILARQRTEAAWLAASIVGASILNALFKLSLNRPRPELVPHLVKVTNASFPSGHAMISAAIYLTIAIMLSEAQTSRVARMFLMGLAGLLVLLIGCSRIYLGVHWPSDVMAGWCFGSVWAVLVFAVNRALRRRSAGRKVFSAEPTTALRADSSAPF